MKPNIVMIMSDDHAWQAISAYKDTPVRTPEIDRIAADGLRLDACCCANSLCAPSRATILTGKHSHHNGVSFLHEDLDNTQPMFPALFQQNGYRTGLFGKWHLGHGPGNVPAGFDDWEILIDQGEYFDPQFQNADGIHQEQGYATELISQKSTDWIRQGNSGQPFMLLSWHKAPHRRWHPATQYKDIYKDVNFPHPATFDDDYVGREAAAAAIMRIEDLQDHDYKIEMPDFTDPAVEKDWKFQRYMQDYWACIKSVDDAVGEMRQCLEELGLLENTVFIYTSDQGFYTGEHGWFDKRFIYEESLLMPFLIQYPAQLAKDRHVKAQVSNIDFAATLLDFAGISAEALEGDGTSFRSVLPVIDDGPELDINADIERLPAEGRNYIYYRYWDYPAEHNVFPHFGLRDARYTLACFMIPSENDTEWRASWELFDREVDSDQLVNLAGDEAYQEVFENLQKELVRQAEIAGDELPEGIFG